MNVYAWIGLFGAVLLVLSLIFDDLLDGLDLDTGGVLSTTTIGAFMASFGLVGYVSSNSGVSTGLTGVLAVVTGLAIGALVVWLTRKLMSMSDTDVAVSSQELLGSVAIAVSRIEPGFTGEVSVRTSDGRRRRMNALANRVVAEGEEVIVTTVLSPTQVSVEPLG